jgi:hypothetical protein
MGINFLFAAVFCSIIALSTCPECFAAIYKYVDKDGMVYFADDLQSIPPQYRATAKIVSGEDKEENKDQTKKHEQRVHAETKKSEVISGAVSEKPIVEKKEDSDSFGRRAMISTIVVVSALFVFVILRILNADHKKSVAITRIIIVWGVSVFLLYTHAGDVIAVFSSIGGKIENTQQQAEEKGKKAAKAVKALDALIDRVENSSSDPLTAESDKK